MTDLSGAVLRGARERRVRTGGVELCVAELGDPGRPTVVLVHGYPDSKEVWSEVAPRLAERFHVVAYDVRGHGRSTAPHPLRGGFTLEKLTDDFLAVADAVSPDEPVHLVGHDWGSVQAWEFVTVGRAEGRIASFTSMSGPSLDHFGHWIGRRLRRPTPRRVGQLLGQGARSWYVYLLHTPVLPELAWRGPLGRRWPRVLERFENIPGAGDGGYPTSSLPSDAAHGAWLYRDNVRTRLRAPRADAYAHVPVQLVTPLEDAFLSERLHDGLELWAPRLTRRTLPAKHWVPRTHPDLLTTWITEFVTSVEAGRTEVTAPGRHADRFGGQLVLVTGAGRGIGRATVLALAGAGARVVAVDRDEEAAVRTAEEARSAGASAAWARTVDVSDAPAMERLAEEITAEHGVVDLLVNTAEAGPGDSFLRTAPEDWKQVLDAGLWGVIHGCRLFGARMAERGQGGHIVNVASVAACRPSRVSPARSTAEAAVLMLSKCLRAELADRRIGVTAVCPGPVTTGITSGTRPASADAGRERRRGRRAARLHGLRDCPPERVAAAILRAVVRNDAVAPVPPRARGGYPWVRWLPGALRRISRTKPPG
ncbi:SDR family oxidoreductase [Streptomyces prasinopilosus]|uniref:NADP-dependent 3-hydroxy acid dehydrogenase YdfG n=1 Tax=Streptomyces prasinopilosus TaxID=67344 RepID=A0A1G6X6S8_9ACTN|nr:NADP-dependent 3-hydroxy acid dehydrogenase YdfG [Streptomyces prasinopilosus]